MSQAHATGRLDLSIGGMTCASCANRIERKLNKLDGVTASVNFATHQAAIAYDSDRQTPEGFVRTVEGLGYTAHLPPPPRAEPAEGAGAGVAGPADPAEQAEAQALASLRQRLLVSTVLTVPVVVLAMIPALQSVALRLLDEHLHHCVMTAVEGGGAEGEEKVSEAFAAIERLVRS